MSIFTIKEEMCFSSCSSLEHLIPPVSYTEKNMSTWGSGISMRSMKSTNNKTKGVDFCPASHVSR